MFGKIILGCVEGLLTKYSFFFFFFLIDLSKNRLVEVPMELCQFVSLEVLNLYHNCIKVIPEAIVNLQMLTYLNLR